MQQFKGLSERHQGNTRPVDEFHVRTLSMFPDPNIGNSWFQSVINEPKLVGSEILVLIQDFAPTFGRSIDEIVHLIGTLVQEYSRIL